MGEYYRTDDNQIRAHFAFRVGLLARQYEGLVLNAGLKDTATYDGTLTACLLQALLVNTEELRKNMIEEGNLKSLFDTKIKDDDSWGIIQCMIRKDSFRKRSFKLKHLVTHLRNALSHPTKIDLKRGDRITTGYTTIPEERLVNRFLFVDAPDIKHNGQPRSHYREIIEPELSQLKGVTLQREERTDGAEKYILIKGGAPYFRQFIIEIPLQNLKQLLFQLSLLLAQPMFKEWDGRHIEDGLFEMDQSELIDIDETHLEV